MHHSAAKSEPDDYYWKATGCASSERCIRYVAQQLQIPENAVGDGQFLACRQEAHVENLRRYAKVPELAGQLDMSTLYGEPIAPCDRWDGEVVKRFDVFGCDPSEFADDIVSGRTEMMGCMMGPNGDALGPHAHPEESLMWRDSDVRSFNLRQSVLSAAMVCAGHAKPGMATMSVAMGMRNNQIAEDKMEQKMQEKEGPEYAFKEVPRYEEDDELQHDCNERIWPPLILRFLLKRKAMACDDVVKTAVAKTTAIKEGYIKDIPKNMLIVMGAYGLNEIAYRHAKGSKSDRVRIDCVDNQMSIEDYFMQIGFLQPQDADASMEKRVRKVAHAAAYATHVAKTEPFLREAASSLRELSLHYRACV